SSPTTPVSPRSPSYAKYWTASATTSPTSGRATTTTSGRTATRATAPAPRSTIGQAPSPKAPSYPPILPMSGTGRSSLGWRCSTLRLRPSRGLGMERASVILEKARSLAPTGRDRELSVLLLYVGGHSPVEVAEVLGLSHDTKKVLLDHSL